MRVIETTQSSSSLLPTFPAEPGPTVAADVFLPPRTQFQNSVTRTDPLNSADLVHGYRFRGFSRYPMLRGKNL